MFSVLAKHQGRGLHAEAVSCIMFRSPVPTHEFHGTTGWDVASLPALEAFTWAGWTPQQRSSTGGWLDEEVASSTLRRGYLVDDHLSCATWYLLRDVNGEFFGASRDKIL